jgi:hypothetical protein
MFEQELYLAEKAIAGQSRLQGLEAQAFERRLLVERNRPGLVQRSRILLVRLAMHSMSLGGRLVLWGLPAHRPVDSQA